MDVGTGAVRYYPPCAGIDFNNNRNPLCGRIMRKIAIVAGLMLAALCIGISLYPYSTAAKSEHRVNQIEDMAEKKVALTYDDGPNEVYTERLLEVLRQEDVKATFFLLGKAVSQHPQLVKETYDQGHLIGNHTYNHVDISKLSKADAAAEILDTNRAIQASTGEYPYLFRPPFGKVNAGFERNSEMLVALWDVDPRDWSCQNTDKIVRHVEKHVKENSVILMHDAYPETVEATKRIIPLLKEQGYKFVTMDEILFE